MCRRRMVAQDGQSLGKYAAHSVIERQCDARFCLRPQQSVEVENRNGRALQRKQEFVEGFGGIGQNRSRVINAVERQNCSHDSVNECP